MGHAWLKRSDPRFWGASLPARSSPPAAEPRADARLPRADYNIKELALYDLPALVDHVRRDTGYDKVRAPLARSSALLRPRRSVLILRFGSGFTDRLHRPLAGQRDHVLLARAGHGARAGREAEPLHRARARRLRRPAHDGLPLHGAQEHAVEDVEEVVRCVVVSPLVECRASSGGAAG